MVKKDGMILEKQHRGRLHPRFLRFLSPGNGGTEGGVKTIEMGLGRKWSSPCRRDGEVEKTPFLMGKSDANERNESWLSNCRVQLAITYLWE